MKVGKTILSFWGPVTFQGRALKLQVGIFFSFESETKTNCGKGLIPFHALFGVHAAIIVLFFFRRVFFDVLFTWHAERC